MIQDIITLIIVFTAVAYAVWSLLGAVAPGSRSKCDGCTSCSLKDELTGIKR